MQIGGAKSWSTFSDGRFKKNIEPLQESLDKVLQLQGVSYQMKADEFPKEHFDSATQVGLIAQDVEKIVPEVVTEGPNGYKAIDYAKLVPLLIESIKAMQKEIDTVFLEQTINKVKCNPLQKSLEKSKTLSFYPLFSTFLLR